MDLVVFGEGNYAADSSKRAFCPLEDYTYDIQKSLRGQYDQQFTVEIDNNGDYWPVGPGSAPDQNSYRYGYKPGRFSTVGPESTRSLSERLESIAVVLTNWGLQTTNDTVRGDAIAEESYVRVRWQWIALPVILEVASLALLVLTVVQSRRENVPL